MPEVISTGEGDTTVLKAPGEGPFTLQQATTALQKAREEAYGTPETETPGGPGDTAPEAGPQDTSPPETPSEIQAEAPKAPPGETTEAPEAVEEPPIDPPRSWTKEEKERFKTLPRETQGYLAERERERDRAISRSQQEAAERRKAFESAQQQAEQIRAQYESALPQMVATMQSQIMGEFADIKTWADAEKLAQEDPFRYQRFQLAQTKAQAAQQELAVAQQRQTQEIASKWNEYRTKEDELFAQHAPEMADTAKARVLRDQVKATLSDLGFSDDELKAAWAGQTGISMRDHRVQLVLREAALWRQAQARAKAVTKAPVPPVQKPGTARPRGSDNEAEINNLTKQLETASGDRAVRLATKLHQLRRSAG